MIVITDDDIHESINLSCVVPILFDPSSDDPVS